jgi:hypothetical protein
MNDLERLCEALRRAKRPDAAQILENRTEAEWKTMGGGGAAESFQRTTSRSPRVLLRCFSWGSTPESVENHGRFWAPVSADLDRSERARGVYE